MARGFSSAPGASREIHEALEPQLDKARMLTLGTTRNALVRATVAARPDCPFGLMVTLAHDYSADVRSAVAGNPRAQRSVMQYLAADRAVPVVLSLVTNPALPEDLLEELAFHKKAAVRAAASARLDSGTPGVSQPLFEDKHTPELAEHVSLVTDVDDLEIHYPGGSAFLVAEPTTFIELEPARDDSVEAELLPVAVGPAGAVAVDNASTASQMPHGSHTPGHGDASVTRVAPVRGFRPPIA